MATEEERQKANFLYFQQCRDLESYEALGKQMGQWPEMRGMSLTHLGNRGQYDRYPERMATHAKNKHDKPLFVQCHQCGRRYCTDAWLPFGYATVYSYVRLGGEGSHRNPYKYFCVDMTQCHPLDKDHRPRMVPSINYGCRADWK